MATNFDLEIRHDETRCYTIGVRWFSHIKDIKVMVSFFSYVHQTPILTVHIFSHLLRTPCTKLPRFPPRLRTCFMVIVQYHCVQLSHYMTWESIVRDIR